MNFYEHYPLDKVTPADYNPRKINDGAFEKLKESLRTFGVVKAIISNQDGTIVAGHQRTKAMKAIGLTECPAFVLSKNVSLQDEIKFNLMHNSVEVETCKAAINIDLPLGFSVVKPQDINILEKGKGSYIKEICKLLENYGEYGSVVADETGAIIHNCDYAYCSKLLNKSVVVYKMTNEKAKLFCEYMNIDYGCYDYEALGIKPYVQTHCQMSRSRDALKSTLYERYVLKYLNKDMRLCDFGAGKMYYVDMLKKQGYKTHGYEPFFKLKGTEKLSINDVVKFINDIDADVARNGLYDVVVLDSVINSVTSNDYQDYVLTSCNALLDKEGCFFMATRNKQFVKGREKLSYSTDNVRNIEFLDKDDFSATFRKGVWTLQKFHTADSLRTLLKRYFDDVNVIDKKASQLWAICKRPKDLGVERYKKALNIEFNLEYPNAFRHNRQASLVKTVLDCH